MRQRQTAGFTLVELLIVMFLLTGFFFFLTQMLSTSLSIWQRGEERVALEERCGTTLRLVSDDFRRLLAPGLGADGGRLVATAVAFADTKPAEVDAALQNAQAFDWYPEWRFVTRVNKAEGRRMLEERERERVIAEEGRLDDLSLDERVRERLVDAPPAPPVECALRVLPTNEEHGCYLVLHRDVRLLSSTHAAVGAATSQEPKKRWVDGGALPPAAEPLLRNVLHIEALFRSQWTESFDAEVGREGGPERCWDSARAGLFASDHPVLNFSLDHSAESAIDARDDIMPSWIQFLVVVDEGPDAAYTALLAHGIDAATTDIRVEYPERLPPVDEKGFLKIGAEWIQYRGHDGGNLRSVRRGARFTRARTHAAGARVHAGRQGVIRVPVPVAREYWSHVR